MAIPKTTVNVLPAKDSTAQWVEELDGLSGVEHMELVDQKGRRHHYRWVNQVPLNGTRDADQVNLEHNFGHGSQHLSNNFFVLNLLAFFIHQILELCDRGYQYCRSKFSSRKEYWNNLRGAIRLMLFRNFDHLLRNVADPPEVRAPG